MLCGGILWLDKWGMVGVRVIWDSYLNVGWFLCHGRCFALLLFEKTRVRLVSWPQERGFVSSC